jgi:hypothetical protein
MVGQAGMVCLGLKDKKIHLLEVGRQQKVGSMVHLSFATISATFKTLVSCALAMLILKC